MKPLSSLRTGRFSAALSALFLAAFCTAQTSGQTDAPLKPTVSGKFVGNGKNATIKYVLVQEEEPFSGKEAVKLIFTEKDPATVKKPSFDAVFGKLGSALILSVHRDDGGIFGCEVAHSAHKRQGFSSIGKIKMVEFKIEGGNVTGHVSTGGEQDAFGEKWEVDLTFAAPLPAKLRDAPAPAPKPAASEPNEPAKKAPKVASGPLISARQLPLPKDAVEVEFKSTVNQIQFSCARPVDTVAKEFSANLKQKGWKDSAGSLMGKTNAILRREQGEAKLTVMVQPAGAGCVVKIFTEGLDWSGGSDSAAPVSKKAAGGVNVEDIEAQAQKLLNDALKNLPK